MRRVLALLCALLLLPAFFAAYAEEYGIGSRGDKVQQLQERLIALGYLSGAADGIYGKQTSAAVGIFQDINGMANTGSVDGATWQALFSGTVKQLRAGLSRDDEGDAVRELQERLIVLGFSADEADGDYGKKTESAVKAFQKHLLAQGVTAVTASGDATPVTQEYLFSELHSTYLKTVQLGDSDDEVKRVERRLHMLGYLDDTPNTEFDEYTQSTVEAFQLAEGLTRTGVADKTTVDALFSSDARVADHFVAHDIYPGDSGAAVQAVQEAMARYGMLIEPANGKYDGGLTAAIERFYDYLVETGSPYVEHFASRGMISAVAQELLQGENFFVYRGDVKKGASESGVRRVQRRLHTLYYVTASSIDGDYGSVTRAAIEEFQANNRLEVTGVADEATLRELFSARAVGDWTKYKLEISIDDQRVYVYGLNTFGEYELDRTFICSTGVGNSTPTGIFLNTRPLNRWHYFEKFKCWAQYSYQISGDILFHSVLFSGRSESTLRSSSVYNLGRKASHGCVRLRVEDAQWVYENCQRGTVVVVY